MKTRLVILSTMLLLMWATPAWAYHLSDQVTEKTAEGAFCRWWTPADEGGYWMWNDCMHSWRWYPEVYWADVSYYGVQWI